MQSARPARGQGAIAARIEELLDGSALWQAGAARRVQDPLSLRCLTQVHGAALSALQIARDDVELELNSAADSPLVIADTGEMLSNGNFHVPALALAFDGSGSRSHTSRRCASRAASGSTRPRFRDCRCSSPRSAPSTRASRRSRRR